MHSHFKINDCSSLKLSSFLFNCCVTYRKGSTIAFKFQVSAFIFIAKHADIILTLFSDLEGWGYQYSIRIWVKLKLKWSVSGYFFNPEVTNLSFMMASIKWIVVFLFARKFWVPLLVSARLNLAHRTDVKDQCGSLITNFTLRPGSRVNITCVRKHICIRSFKELLIIVCGSVTSAAHEIIGLLMSEFTIEYLSLTRLIRLLCDYLANLNVSYAAVLIKRQPKYKRRSR